MLSTPQRPCQAVPTLPLARGRCETSRQRPAYVEDSVTGSHQGPPGRTVAVLGSAVPLPGGARPATLASDEAEFSYRRLRLHGGALVVLPGCCPRAVVVDKAAAYDCRGLVGDAELEKPVSGLQFCVECFQEKIGAFHGVHCRLVEAKCPQP